MVILLRYQAYTECNLTAALQSHLQSFRTSMEKRYQNNLYFQTVKLTIVHPARWRIGSDIKEPRYRTSNRHHIVHETRAHGGISGIEEIRCM